MGRRPGTWGILQKSTAALDSLYERVGDYKSAYFYNTEYNKYTDSIKSLAKETDLLKLEVDSDNRRRERLEREEEENTQHRHNVQYMGFTVGLAAILLPLHHWLEHKVIHYLTSRRKISAAGVPFFRKRAKKEEALPTEAAE